MNIPNLASDHHVIRCVFWTSVSFGSWAIEITADIVNLLPRGDELWVVTSTKVKEKDALIDVFGVDGAYTDSFYLPLPAWPERHLLRPDPLAIL